MYMVGAEESRALDRSGSRISVPPERHPLAHEESPDDHLAALNRLAIHLQKTVVQKARRLTNPCKDP